MNDDNIATDLDEPIPFMQRLLDSPFILLAIGVIVPTLLYTVWGIVETLAIPVAP